MTGESAFDAAKIEQPDPKLFRYYVLVALMTGPLSPFVLIPLWLRYATLRYKFDDSGVSMKVGVLFRREVYLTYRRIQDIQLTRNLFQRWMGLSTISLQTASGSSDAEISIEGILPAEELRDFLYGRMRGAKNENGPALASMEHESHLASAQPHLSDRRLDLDSDQTVNERATKALEEIRDALHALLEQRGVS